VGFRPTFEGANNGKYPNGLPFSSNDVVDESIVNQVFDSNQMQGYCDREPFRSGFFVEQTSMDLRFLDFDYGARLADTRLTPVQRDQLEAEYHAKRTGMPVEYELVFLLPRTCKSIPPTLVFKALSDVLAAWAHDADTKRGVLKIRASVLTPAILNSAADTTQPGLIRTNLLRQALNRAIANITEIRKIPGSELIRYGKDSLTFDEVQAHLEDLLTAQLQPLIALAGRNMAGVDSIRWVQEMLTAANIQAQQAQASVQSYVDALREYSGAPVAPATTPNGTSKGFGTSDVQSLTPQIDQTFIDRIVAMSAAHTTFRQTLTTEIVNAAKKSVEKRADVDYYSKLLQSLQSVSPISATEADRQLQQIIARAKDLLIQLDDLYDEFSRVSLRSSGMMYQVTRAPDIETARAFSWPQYALVVVGTAAVTLVLGIFVAFVYDRFRERK
jgi:hypothetical protein